MKDPRVVRHPLGFYRAREVPSAETLKEYYASRYYQEEKGIYRHDYPPHEIAYFRVKTAQLAARAAELRKTDLLGSLLDVGSGEGFALQWFAESGWNVEGIDFSSAGMQAMNPAMVDRCEFGDVFELLRQRADSGRRYELIWLKHVLEHVTEPIELLETLKTLALPDGLLVITVPNDFSPLQERLLEGGKIDERFWVALPDHLSYFDRTSLARTAEHCGWKVRDILADFPIDLFLLHRGSNYRRDACAGSDAHNARIEFENMLGEQPHAEVNNFYRAMAKVGLGRSLTAFLQRGED